MFDTELAPSRLRELHGTARPGFSLPQGFYLDADVFERDLELLSRHWSFAGHVSELPQPGAWITSDLGRDSAVIVRGDDGAVRAFANVCRHRGSRLCEGAGAGPFLTCPYHAWSYHLDGRLRRAREMPEVFNPSEYGLRPLPLIEIGGLLFVAFDSKPPFLDEAAPRLARALDLFGWGKAKIALRRTYEIAANWKLAMENYHECYHCAPAHPEFARLHALARPNNRMLSAEPDARSGVADFEAWDAYSGADEMARVMRSHLVAGFQTGSGDGQRLAPPMGAGGQREDGLVIFAELGPLAAFLAYPDHGVIYRFCPVAPLHTRMEVIWLVSGQAEPGRDYDPEALAWLWDVTSVADKTIIERNQAGVRDRAYRPGPFSTMEPGTRQYVERYLAEFALGL